MRSVAARLQVLCDGIVATDAEPRGCIVGVSWPDGSRARACGGVARADAATGLDVCTPFHIASVGKMITATIVMRFAESGAFGPRGVDATLLDCVSRDLIEPGLALKLHPTSERITIRHLLAHTSGLKDATVDGATGTAAQHGGLAPDSIIAAYVRSVRDAERGRGDGAFARHRWTPWCGERPDDPLAGHLNWFVAMGAAATPVCAPGEQFHYSDTAYVVLGLLVEAAAGAPLHVVQREEVLEPLGLTGTYLAYHDDPSPDARAQEMDVWVAGVPLLSRGFDLSFDWGGGGQVSTVDDLLVLVRAVTDGHRLRAGTSVDAMLTATAPEGLQLPRVGIGLGVQHWRVGRRVVVGHAGAWGVRVFIDPDSGIAVAATVGCQDGGAWLADVFDVAEAA